MDGTSLAKILEYAKVLYETGRYSEAKFILVNFVNVIGDNKKHLSKLIMSQWTILCVDFLKGEFIEAKKNFEKVNFLVEELKSSYDEELKKTNNDSVNKLIHKNILSQQSLFFLFSFYKQS